MSNFQQQTFLQSRSQLRQTIRKQRQALTPLQQKTAAKKISRNLHRLLQDSKPAFIKKYRPLRIGVYTAGDGEIQLDFFMKTWLRKTTRQTPAPQFFFPLIQKNKALKFGLKQRNFLPKKNRFGIAEPLKLHALNIRTLDILLMPLVAVSLSGDRLGMGGGFYDRTLAQLKPWTPKPLLIGVAHDFQVLDTLPAAPWDQPLDGVVTDERVFYL